MDQGIAPERGASDARIEGSTFAARVGTALVAVVKHVPTRGVLWAIVGFVLGIAADVGFFVLALATLDRGATLVAEPPFVVVPILVPFAGAALFGMHGLQRGAARAAIEIESKFGLVRYLVDRILAFLHARFGATLANVPLDELERALKEATEHYLGSRDATEGAGISGWVLRKAKTSILAKIDTYLLSAYRAETNAAGRGGGVDLARVGARVTHEMSTRMSELVMSPLNKQLAVFLVLFLGLGVGWFHLGLAAIALIERALH